MTITDTPIAVIGAGSWGTALAVCLSRNGQETRIWGHELDHMETLAAERRNDAFLPGVSFPFALQVDTDLGKSISTAKDVLIVVPSEVFRLVLTQIQPFLTDEHRIAWASKGLEEGTGELLHQVARDVVGEQIPLAVVSGPTFALEVAKGLPTAVTVASDNDAFAQDMVARLHGHEFRAYRSADIAGVEVGGAAKNVLAIAAGIADGLGFGANARAALITRGLNEIMHLGLALGGKPETFMGLTGVGDLVLTCTDNQSRNRRFGLAIGKGNSIADAKASIDQVIEGHRTAKVIHDLARKLGVEMPITEQVYQVLYEGRTPVNAVRSLLDREPKTE